MGDPQPVGHHLGIIDVLPCTAGAAPPNRLAVIVELKGDANHLRARARRESGHDGTVDAARHGDDDSGIARRTAKLKIGPHWSSVAPLFTRISPSAPRPP